MIVVKLYPVLVYICDLESCNVTTTISFSSIFFAFLFFLSSCCTPQGQNPETSLNLKALDLSSHKAKPSTIFSSHLFSSTLDHHPWQPTAQLLRITLGSHSETCESPFVRVKNARNHDSKTWGSPLAESLHRNSVAIPSNLQNHWNHDPLNLGLFSDMGNPRQLPPSCPLLR